MKSIGEFKKMKDSGEKISMITCYDYSSALIVNKTKADCILVGDSLAMTMQGFKDTVMADIDIMALYTAAVSRGATDKFIIGDLPFLSYRSDLNSNINAVKKLMQAGANSVKLEGAEGNLELIKHLVGSGVPVMGHLGLTPQSVNQFGGYKVQGKTEAASKKLQDDAFALEGAGCFALVLECVPAKIAEDISKSLKIPTIGIGAGNKTDGQVLVFQDLLGLNTEFKAKFVKEFLNGAELFTKAINDYTAEVKSKEFPDIEHSF